jgi:hypothetical protein
MLIALVLNVFARALLEQYYKRKMRCLSLVDQTFSFLDPPNLVPMVPLMLQTSSKLMQNALLPKKNQKFKKIEFVLCSKFYKLNKKTSLKVPFG